MLALLGAPVTMAASAAESTSENFVDFDVPIWAWFALIGAIVAMLVLELALPPLMVVVARRVAEPE